MTSVMHDIVLFYFIFVFILYLKISKIVLKNTLFPLLGMAKMLLFHLADIQSPHCGESSFSSAQGNMSPLSQA